jgi:hypothetical protein
VNVGMPDTLKLNDLQKQISLDYTITSFDEGLYYIPPFAILTGNDTLFTNSLSLKVMDDLKVDTVSKQIYDIKGVMKPEFVLTDYIYILAILWFILIVLAVIIYFVFVKKKKLKTLLKKTKTVLPPHLKALKALEKVKEKKLWQQGWHKEYYTQLTDILRIYLYERFSVNAMEMTSDEILNAITACHEADSARENLQQILRLADLVKFAKFTPLPDENDLSYINARLFVNQTQPEEIVNKEIT